MVTGIVIFAIGALFTNFYGLGDLWENRGSWYTVMEDELAVVMANLIKLKAFNDSDGIPNNYVKVRAYYTGGDTQVYYRVKIPNWVFKYESEKMDDAKKAELLGINL